MKWWHRWRARVYRRAAELASARCASLPKYSLEKLAAHCTKMECIALAEQHEKLAK